MKLCKDCRHSKGMKLRWLVLDYPIYQTCRYSYGVTHSKVTQQVKVLQCFNEESKEWESVPEERPEGL